MFGLIVGVVSVCKIVFTVIDPIVVIVSIPQINQSYYELQFNRRISWQPIISSESHLLFVEDSHKFGSNVDRRRITMRLRLFVASLYCVTTLAFAIGHVTPLERLAIMELTSCFENSTPIIQYAYCENIGDGRGYTAGEAGFTSGTHDMLQVVQNYTAREPNNLLAQFLPALVKVDGTNSTEGLDGLCGNWTLAANTDPIFLKVQDDITDELYFFPSQDFADALNLTLPLSRGQLYDAIIQHGGGDDPDGVPNMLHQTQQIFFGHTPASPYPHHIPEELWTSAFMEVRIAHLMDAADPATEPAWAQSVDRVNCYQRIAESKNWQLAMPFNITAYGDPFNITSNPQSPTPDHDSIFEKIAMN